MIDSLGNRTLNDLLAERVALHGDKCWLVFEDRAGQVSEFSYRQFADKVAGSARGFASIGIGHGDAVVVHLRNSPEFLIAWFALAAIGAVIVPSNTANTAPELDHIIGHSEAVAAITESDYLDMFRALQSDHARMATLILARGGTVPEGMRDFGALVATGGEMPDVVVRSEDLQELIFTSGTTAKPKAVMLTHANALHGGEETVKGVMLDNSDRCLTALPLFHCNAQALTVLGALTAGATLILLEEFRASRFWEQVRQYRATYTSLVAMQLRTLLAQPPAPTDNHHHVRRLFYAINVTDAEKEAFEQRYAVKLINGYGMSELMILGSIVPVFGPQKWPSIGLPSLDRSIRICDEEGKDVPIGKLGEIVVSGVPGRTCMKGYFKDEAATAQALRDGWLHTGDNGYLDEQGYLYFFDRKKDVIKRAGENISASEVEAVLTQHPGIIEAAVIGVPDPVRDEAVKAFVVCQDGETLTAEGIRHFCSTRLSPFKIPTEIEFLKTLPRTSIGKIEKKALKPIH